MRRPVSRTRRAVARLAIVVGVVAALGSCTSYDPSLPDEPFLCGDQEPRCPEGFTCVARPPGEMVCRKDGTAPPDAAPASVAP